jgi:hypothetical protein
LIAAAVFVLCENDDILENKQFQDVLSGFAQAACLTTGPSFRYTEKHGELRRQPIRQSRLQQQLSQW